MKFFWIVICLFLCLPFLVMAKVGVGIGTGKIVVDQDLKPGLIYTLPSVVVLNTGDVASNYEVSIEHRENQTEFKPGKEWFSFTPEIFYLEPGGQQTVDIKLSLPVKGVQPGDYFAFLSAHPVKSSDAQGTTVGVAAATKVYFTVLPANFLTGIYYRLTSLLATYSPYSYIILIVVGLAFLITIFRKLFAFNIGVSLKKK